MYEIKFYFISFHFQYFIDKLKYIRLQARTTQILSNNKMEQRQNSCTNLPKLIRLHILLLTI